MAKETKSLLAEEKLQFIGLLEATDEGGDLVYKNLVLTVEDGKITGVEVFSTGYSQNDMINDATSWIDTHYWRH